jgi:hypothetical protein
LIALRRHRVDGFGRREGGSTEMTNSTVSSGPNPEML